MQPTCQKQYRKSQNFHINCMKLYDIHISNINVSTIRNSKFTYLHCTTYLHSTVTLCRHLQLEQEVHFIESQSHRCLLPVSHFIQHTYIIQVVHIFSSIITGWKYLRGAMAQCVLRRTTMKFTTYKARCQHGLFQSR